jgi:hypothetical protein
MKKEVCLSGFEIFLAIACVMALTLVGVYLYAKNVLKKKVGSVKDGVMSAASRAVEFLDDDEETGVLGAVLAGAL